MPPRNHQAQVSNQNSSRHFRFMFSRHSACENKTQTECLSSGLHRPSASIMTSTGVCIYRQTGECHCRDATVSSVENTASRGRGQASVALFDLFWSGVVEDVEVVLLTSLLPKLRLLERIRNIPTSAKENLKN